MLKLLLLLELEFLPASVVSLYLESNFQLMDKIQVSIVDHEDCLVFYR